MFGQNKACIKQSARISDVSRLVRTPSTPGPWLHSLSCSKTNREYITRQGRFAETLNWKCVLNKQQKKKSNQKLRHAWACLLYSPYAAGQISQGCFVIADFIILSTLRDWWEYALLVTGFHLIIFDSYRSRALLPPVTSFQEALTDPVSISHRC